MAGNELHIWTCKKVVEQGWKQNFRTKLRIFHSKTVLDDRSGTNKVLLILDKILLQIQESEQ